MSNRSQRREAGRQARKLAQRVLRQPQPQQEQQHQQQIPTEEGHLMDAAHAPTNSAVSDPASTNAGREASSMNALKHGSCSNVLLLPSESMEDFLALEKRWFKAYNVHPNSPESEYEAELIRTAVRAEWFYLRADRNYADCERQTLLMDPSVLYWTNTQHHNLQRFMRYRTSHANCVAKHRKALEDYRKARAAEQASDLKLTTAKTKLRVYEEKNQPKLTWQEEAARLAAEYRRIGVIPPDKPKTA